MRFCSFGTPNLSVSALPKHPTNTSFYIPSQKCRTSPEDIFTKSALPLTLFSAVLATLSVHMNYNVSQKPPRYDGVGGLKTRLINGISAYEDAITWLWCVEKLSVFIMVADVATRWRLFSANNSVSLYPLKILRPLSSRHTLSLHIHMYAHTHTHTAARWHTVAH